ncbi:hypothetical protein E6O75_ATG05058 [Venturia nashicola]|uniref:Uncharacterized protein n=1 Tax=Venturia nashicola TaxID=86259 RepID=A0A4Z1P2P8_9PEZI|nr:hypothetical protein E6O75_ATG05058 [Venturia nashicola]
MNKGVQAMLLEECMEDGDEDMGLIPGLKFRLNDIKEHVETLKKSVEANKTSTAPNEWTRFNRMTDGDEYLFGAENQGSPPVTNIIQYDTIFILQFHDNRLPKDLDRCRQILESIEDIEEDSAEDDGLAVVAQDIYLIIEALESIEESESFEDLIDTPIGTDLQTSMDVVQGYVLEQGIFSERDDHEVCTETLEVLDIVSRLLGELDG